MAHDDPETPPWHLGDIIGKLMRDAGIDRKQMAELTGHRRNTIGDLLNGKGESEPKTIENVLRVLNKSREYVDRMVAQANGQTATVVRIRTPEEMRDRDYDKDPVKREAAEYARKIAIFPPEVQMAIFNIVRAFETALTRDRKTS